MYTEISTKWRIKRGGYMKSNEKEIAFVICVNNEMVFQECVYYINRLQIPEGYTLDVIAIREAESMCSAYNEAMKCSQAKYKVYLHQIGRAHV